jgi:DNA-binding phage protein
MGIKKAVGRPPKMNMRTITKLADAITHNTNITDSCRYAGISRNTYYRQLNGNPVFAEKMSAAMANRNKVVFSFVATY